MISHFGAALINIHLQLSQLYIADLNYPNKMNNN